MKQELTKEIKEAILNNITVDQENRTVLYLENSRLDFSSKYIFLGFRGKTQVLLGLDMGNGLKKCVGFVRKRSENLFSLWTDSYNYSMRFEVRS